jgi:hypothetical protein
MNTVILHTAEQKNDDVEPLNKRLPIRDGPQNPNYSLVLKESSAFNIKDQDNRSAVWTTVNDDAKNHMNTQGAGNGYLVTSFNRTRGDEAVVVIIRWSADMHSVFEDASRPEGCCCNIF